MRDVILIFLGGGIGSVVRFSLGKWINGTHDSPFPWGTLVVNFVACLTLGFIIGLADQKQIISPAARLFWTVGFCGGFSTFSTFSYETLYLLQSGGLTTTMILYIVSSLILCIAATYGGILTGELI